MLPNSGNGVRCKFFNSLKLIIWVGGKVGTPQPSMTGIVPLKLFWSLTLYK